MLDTRRAATDVDRRSSSGAALEEPHRFHALTQAPKAANLGTEHTDLWTPQTVPPGKVLTTTSALNEYFCHANTASTQNV